MTDPLIEGFPVALRWPVAWADMDAFQHVNNVVYFRWFESARIRYFERIGWASDQALGGVGPILASTSCTFRAPLTYPDVVHVGARVEDVRADRFTMRYRILSQRLGRSVAEGAGTVVAFDYVAGVKATLPEHVRAAITEVEGA